MSLIPESGKPADLNLDLIDTSEDCEIVAEWLATVVKDIDRQLEANSNSGMRDAEWVRKSQAAIRATDRTRFKVLEMKKTITKSGKTASEAFREAAHDIFEPEDLVDIYNLVEQRYPGMIPDMMGSPKG